MVVALALALAPEAAAVERMRYEVPWLRARGNVVVGTYTYDQTPAASDPGPLLAQPIIVGTSEGGSPAVPVGYEVDARAWLKSVPYLGFHANFRSAYYVISAAQFADLAPDWLYNIQADVLGRVPVELDDTTLWGGIKAGFHFNDFLVFTGCLAPGCAVSFDTVGQPALGLGVEGGIEVGRAYGIAGYTLGLADVSFPYASAIDLEGGLAVHQNVYVNLGFGTLHRRMLLTGRDSGKQRGEISDGQILFRAGAGFALP